MSAVEKAAQVLANHGPAQTVGRCLCGAVIHDEGQFHAHQAQALAAGGLLAGDPAGEPETDERGLLAKYRVEKINDPAGKHDACRYFVLDPQHDPIAREALNYYAGRCPSAALRRDLRDWLDGIGTPAQPAVAPSEDVETLADDLHNTLPREWIEWQGDTEDGGEHCIVAPVEEFASDWLAAHSAQVRANERRTVLGEAAHKIERTHTALGKGQYVKGYDAGQRDAAREVRGMAEGGDGRGH